jgi:hypothetical protein
MPKKLDFMQYPEDKVPPLSCDQEDVLSGYGQFYSCVSDFEFLAKLRAGTLHRKDRDKWFEENSDRQVFYIAQGILASVYGEDPP